MKRNQKLLALLQRLQHCYYDDGEQICPECNENFAKYGHHHDCDLANMISSLGGEVKIHNEMELNKFD